MAKAKAQNYFNTFSAADQKKIKDSWGGSDMMDEWYDNAVKAGAISPDSNVGQAGTGTTEQQTTGAAAGRTYADDNADAGAATTGDPYLDELRSGKVAGAEDWRRFSNAQLKAWEKDYVGGGKFKNDYGDIVGKPDDDGPISNGRQALFNTGRYSSIDAVPTQNGGGGAAAPAAAAASTDAAYYGQDDPLQRYLTGLLENGQGSFTGVSSGGQLAGGGVWSQPGSFPASGTPAAEAAVAPVATAAPAATNGGYPVSMPAAAIRGNEAAKAAKASSIADEAKAGVSLMPGYNPGSSALQALGGGSGSANMVAAPVSSTFNGAKGTTPFAQPQGSTLEDMINPERRRPRDARTGGSWF